MSETLIGRVENGAIKQVTFPFYSGPAGFRDLGNGTVAFSYLGSAPTAKMVGQSGTIGGEAYSVTRADRVKEAGMITVIAVTATA